MTDSGEKLNEPILTFEGKRYDLKSLPDDAKEWVRGIQVADTQIQTQQDSLKVLALGRQTMIVKLKATLEKISPIS
tara:strand:- start:138 stop:365 length:228 start_codon:yes stop_codon:yes gene_type:complete